MISALICTHGKSAPALLSSAEMICGKQKHVETVNFKIGENIADLKKELLSKIELLPLAEGIIFFVDLKGGTPFNSIFELSNDVNISNNSNIITGTNVAMLIEFFIKRNNFNLTYQEILSNIENAGKESIATISIQNSNIIKDDSF